MVNAILKLLNLFNLVDKKNSNEIISPNKSKLNLINNKYMIKAILILVIGISHGFVIGALSYFM